LATALVHGTSSPPDDKKKLWYYIEIRHTRKSEIDTICSKTWQIIAIITPLLNNKDIATYTTRILYNTIFIPKLCF
jgi:hypothetical protein